jgi:high affinity Mn2+ porin
MQCLAAHPHNRLDMLKLVRLGAMLIAIWSGFAHAAVAAETGDGQQAVPALISTGVAPSLTDGMAGPESWALHGQVTNVTQGHSRFASPYSGTNSLSASGRTEETTDLTIYAGVRLWHGAELWINPEVDQGFGLSNTVGMAGFPSGEAYKIGANTPYFRIPRAFFRQVIPLGGKEEKVEGTANQLGGTGAADFVTLTAGKFSVTDIFDTNSYAHDPRADFLNWSLIDAGAFDYAADSWGFTYGAAAEWKHGGWTSRGGVFQLSSIPNGKVVAVDFSQYMLVGEIERRYQWSGRPGKLKVLAFVNHGRMATYQDAIELARQTNVTPDVALVRHFNSRPGATINLEQQLSSDLGVFFRASVNDGNKEAYEFSEINKSMSAGISMKGERWGRANDSLGVAGVINLISSAARDYFKAGGIGILIGDGRLNYGPEKILETYYSLHVTRHVALSIDYQHATNPSYNRDRGPMSIYSVRMHAEF